MKEEYEVVKYKQSNLHVILVDLLYRTPHLHKDIEVSVVLENEVDLICPTGTEHMEAGDFYVLDPFVSHELSASRPCRILALQIPLSYFRAYFPQIEVTEFTRHVFRAVQFPELCRIVRNHMLAIGGCFFTDDELTPLACAAHINELFLDLLTYCPYTIMTEQDRQKNYSRGKRMRRLIKYIDAHHEEKVLLSDFAAEEGLDLYYLSHSFKDYFGMSFQEYVMRVRCEHASKLLLATNYSLLDISLRCGFSDPKYMKKGFLKQFGCTPREYREKYSPDMLSSHRPDTITNQDIIDPALCRSILKKYNYIL